MRRGPRPIILGEVCQVKEQKHREIANFEYEGENAQNCLGYRIKKGPDYILYTKIAPFL